MVGAAEAVAAAAAAVVVAAAVAAAAAGTPIPIPFCPLLHSFLSEAVRRAYEEALLSTAKDRYALAVLHVALAVGGTTRCVTRVAASAEVAAARCDARRTAAIRLPGAAVYGGGAQCHQVVALAVLPYRASADAGAVSAAVVSLLGGGAAGGGAPGGQCRLDQGRGGRDEGADYRPVRAAPPLAGGGSRGNRLPPVTPAGAGGGAGVVMGKRWQWRRWWR